MPGGCPVVRALHQETRASKQWCVPTVVAAEEVEVTAHARPAATFAACGSPAMISKRQGFRQEILADKPAQPSCAWAPSVSPLSAGSLSAVSIRRYLLCAPNCTPGCEWRRRKGEATGTAQDVFLLLLLLLCRDSKYVDGRHRHSSVQ